MTGRSFNDFTFQIKDEIHISQARIAARELAMENGFNEVIATYIATSVSELAGNIVFHVPDGGAITLRIIKRGSKTGVEIIASDNGPGIPDLNKAMQDGFSTIRGLGGGLPGVRRLMDEFEIVSAVGKGTKVTAIKWQNQ